MLTQLRSVMPLPISLRSFVFVTLAVICCPPQWLQAADDTANVSERDVALWVLREAEVAQLILTHISPRYTETSALLAEAREIFAQTEVAEDFACFDVVRSVYSAGSEFSPAGGS